MIMALVHKNPLLAFANNEYPARVDIPKSMNAERDPTSQPFLRAIFPETNPPMNAAAATATMANGITNAGGMFIPEPSAANTHQHTDQNRANETCKDC